jgi:hypothetical protein
LERAAASIAALGIHVHIVHGTAIHTCVAKDGSVRWIHPHSKGTTNSPVRAVGRMHGSNPSLFQHRIDEQRHVIAMSIVASKGKE